MELSLQLELPLRVCQRTKLYSRALRESTIRHGYWSENPTLMGDHSLITLSRQKIYMVYRFEMPNVTLWLTNGATSTLSTRGCYEARNTDFTII